MTKLSKSLAVALFVGCLAFLGFAGVVVVGGPNWESEAEELSDSYVFEQEGAGEETQWKVWTRAASRTGGPPLAQSKVLADVVLKAYKDQEQQQRDKLSQLSDDIPKAQQERDEARKLIEADVPALEAKIKQLSDELAQLQEQYNQVAQEVFRTAQSAETIRKEAERRRDDVYRQRLELAEIEADRQRAQRQEEKLRETLVSVRGQIQRLQQRQAQLQKASN